MNIHSRPVKKRYMEDEENRNTAYIGDSNNSNVSGGNSNNTVSNDPQSHMVFCSPSANQRINDIKSTISATNVKRRTVVD